MARAQRDPDRLRGFRVPIINVWLGGYTRSRSFVTLIYLAMLADGYDAPEEREEVFALLDRARTLRELPHTKVQRLLETTVKEARTKPHLQLVEKATRRFRGRTQLAKSVFMHAADILLADRALVESEEHFIEQLAFYLQIDTAEGTRLFETLQMKNRH
ncbi:MAG: TerB family tellurite resistance protein [Terricaulis sp.]